MSKKQTNQYMPTRKNNYLSQKAAKVQQEANKKAAEQIAAIQSSGPRYIKSDILLTISLLVSNNIKYIRKCMDSLVPILNAIPSELICVDTVGPEKSDGSLEVVKEYTDKVYHFDWCDDFSAARNVGIDHARGEWFMFIDDDEWFEDPTEIIEFFTTAEYKKYLSANYCVKNYVPGGHVMSTVSRMIRRTTETRFVEKIHEQLNDLRYPAKFFNCWVHHYGYYFQTEEQKMAKSKRNLTLLEEEIQEMGPYPKACAQIVQEYMAFDSVEAGKRCNEYINILKDKHSDGIMFQWMLTVPIRLAAATDSVEAVLDQEKLLHENYKLNELSELIVAQKVAQVAFEKGGEWRELSYEYIKKYFSLLDWLNSHENEKIQQVVLDNVQFMNDVVLYCMVKAAVIYCNEHKMYEEAYEYIKRFDFEYSQDIKADKRLIEWTLKELPSPEPAIEFYKQFYNDEIFEKEELHKFLPSILRNRL